MEELIKKIDELTQKVEFLETEEKKRIKKKKIDTTLKIIKYGIIISIILMIYIKFNNKFIKPTKEKIDFVEEKISSVDGKVDSIGETVKEKWESIKNWNPLKKD